MSDDEFRFIKTNRDCKCVQCGLELKKDDRVCYSWKQRLIWCLMCAKKGGIEPTPQTNDTAPEASTTASEASMKWIIVTDDDDTLVLRRR